MNSRQRRGVLLLLLSALCALGVFAVVIVVINDVESKVGPEVTAYELKQDVPAYQELDEDQLRKVRMPERWLPDTAVTKLGELRGKITVSTLHKGSLLQAGMVVERPALKPGEQEIAIMIDAATGVAGKIDPGATVNIYATFGNEKGRNARGDQTTAPESRVIVSHARVIDVGRLTSLDEDDDRNRANEAVPITFALNTLDAQRVAYAESFAENVRLALVAPGSDETIPEDERTYTLSGDK